jgi:caa(3)-type oxidase subunit IV
MVETHSDDSHHGPNVNAYYVVFGALAGFTAISFGVNSYFGPGSMKGMLIILGVAVIKAVLVAFIFMHLKWEWRKLYFMIVPALVLAPMLVIVLLPDIVLAWRNAEKAEAKPAAVAADKK